MGPKNTVIAIVAVVAIGTGAWLSSLLTTTPAEPRTATVLPGASALPEFALLDQNGEPFGRDAFEGHWSLVFFGFTHCPDICPLTLQTLANAQQQLAAVGADPLPRIVLVSVDPERDTPEIMRDYVGYFGSGHTGVTGELDELRKLTSSLGIFFAKSGIEGDSYSVDHSSVVLLLNPEGRRHALFSAPHEVDNFVHDLPIIMAAR